MRVLFLAAALAFVSSGAVGAADLIGSYQAWIGQPDLYNSQGKRLTEVWQVLRQDRANVHRFGIRQPGDQDDPFFASPNNRAAMERMIRAGRIDRSAAAVMLNGGVMVEVRLYGRRGVAETIDVMVLP